MALTPAEKLYGLWNEVMWEPKFDMAYFWELADQLERMGITASREMTRELVADRLRVIISKIEATYTKEES